MLGNIGNLRVTQSARVSLSGQVYPTHAVMYTVADQGPFTDNFTDSQFTPDTVATMQAARIVKLYHLGVKLDYPPKLVSTNPNVWDLAVIPNPSNLTPQAAAIEPTTTFRFIEALPA